MRSDGPELTFRRGPLEQWERFGILPGSEKRWAADTVFPSLPPCPMSKTTPDPSIWPLSVVVPHPPPVEMTRPPPAYAYRGRHLHPAGAGDRSATELARQ